ncbi:hypothetical protein HOY80DRAFT_886624 [Tuber brumale]|nr:hypothetical protein HOY80DRAFT_886624 [Tuber brumale]
MSSQGTTALCYSTPTSPHCRTTTVPHRALSSFLSPPLLNKLIHLLIGFSVLLPVMGPEIINPCEWLGMLAAGIPAGRPARGTVLFGRILVPLQIRFAAKAYLAEIASVGARVLVTLYDVQAPIVVHKLVEGKRLNIVDV